MRILTYKRTHTGDPNEGGLFGVHDCMGRVRSYGYDAVIGVGGMGSEPRLHGIAGKITWVGIGPKRHFDMRSDRGEVVTFRKFVLLDENGPLLSQLAPHLAKRMYSGPRFVLNSYSEAEKSDALWIVNWAKTIEGKANTISSTSLNKVNFVKMGCKKGPCGQFRPLRRGGC